MKHLTSYLLALTSSVSACALAASPLPLATISGELRNFSPDSRYAAVFDRSKVALYDTSNWKQLGEITVEQSSRFLALLVDNGMYMGGIYDTHQRQRRMEIWAFRDRLISLGALKISDDQISNDRSVGLNKGALSIDGLSQIHTGRSAGYRSPRQGILHEGDDYRVFTYSCPVDKYLEVAGRLSAVMRSEDADQIQRACTRTYVSFSSGGPAQFLIYQSDYAVSRRISTMGYTGHPSTGPGQYVLKDGPQKIEAISSGVDYVTTGKDPMTKLERITTSGYEMISGPQWQIRVKSSGEPAFELTQLGVPGYVPQRVSPDGKLVALSNGASTKIYAADVVTDRYANMDRGVLQDLLMEKITNALKANRSAEALPDFDRLSRMGNPLPESFFYYRLEALANAGRRTEARAQAEAYLEKFGKSGKYYSNVISLMARL